MGERWNTRGIIKQDRKNIPKMSMDSFYKILSLTTNKPLEEVKEIVSAMENLITYTLSKGYQINIPSIGTFRPVLHQGYKKGSRVAIYHKGMGRKALENSQSVDDTKKKIILEDGQYYLEYSKNSSPYVVPRFSFSRTIKDDLKDSSITWEE